MISSLLVSLTRVVLFWYFIGVLVLFLGDPAWAEVAYARLSMFSFVPELELHGLATAASVQFRLLAYWTVPVLLICSVVLILGGVAAYVQTQGILRLRAKKVSREGCFWGVAVSTRSLGKLPLATTPGLTGTRIVLSGAPAAHEHGVELSGRMAEAMKLLTVAEVHLCEQLLQLLYASKDHFAGLGHGVGLLEHTMNVVSEAVPKVTADFRLPLMAALAHDIGKLVTFYQDESGAWQRRGLHSRESARILATLPAFQQLPELHQRALLLAVKYDHAPSKMPELASDHDATMLALRTISALTHADRKATADEKSRHLERLQPEDLLWKDFSDFLRNAPVVERGKKGQDNQVNNPADGAYLYIYEAPWRDAAMLRLPAEVAAALDLTRRDAGKLAKYTQILIERLRKDGLLVEELEVQAEDGTVSRVRTAEQNPLWDIKSGTGDKGVVIRGVLVLRADALWRLLNYKLGISSPFPVKVVAPNTDAVVSDLSEAVVDVSTPEVQAQLGLDADGASAGRAPKTRARAALKSAPPSNQPRDSELGLVEPRPGKPKKAAVTDKPASIEEQSAPTERLSNADSAEPSHSLDESSNIGAAMSAAMSFLQASEPPVVQEPVAAPETVEATPLAKEVALPPAPTASPSLSRAERKLGLAIADAAAVEMYPELSVGDKYYPAEAVDVVEGRVRAGALYGVRGKKEGQGSAVDVSPALNVQPPAPEAGQPEAGPVGLVANGGGAPKAKRRKF